MLADAETAQNGHLGHLEVAASADPQEAQLVARSCIVAAASHPQIPDLAALRKRRLRRCSTRDASSSPWRAGTNRSRGGVGDPGPSTSRAGSSPSRTSPPWMEERLLPPPLRWRLVEVPFGLDYPYWLDDPDFDLDFHVREPALPPGGRRSSPSRSPIVSRPLDRARPLWELYLIHGLGDGQKALLTKIHHSLIDASPAPRSWECCSTWLPRAGSCPARLRTGPIGSQRSGDADPGADGVPALSASNAPLAAQGAAEPRRVAGLRRHPRHQPGREGDRTASPVRSATEAAYSRIPPTRLRRPGSTDGSRPTAASSSASSSWTR